MILFVLLLVLFVVGIVFFCVKGYIINDDTITLFTGSNGSGKTFFAVKKAKSEYRKLKIKRFFHNFFESIIFWKTKKDYWEKIRFFSSIPVKLSKRKFSEPLSVDYLVMKKKLPLRCVVFVDEVNLICSQMQYKLKCEDSLNMWVTLFRHFTHGGKLILTTQNYNKVHWIFRYCVGHVHNLSSCHKIPFVCLWTTCRKVNVGDDTRQVISLEGEESTRFLFGFFNLFYREYDTYCFDRCNEYDRLNVPYYSEYDCYKIERWEKLN